MSKKQNSNKSKTMQDTTSSATITTKSSVVEIKTEKTKKIKIKKPTDKKNIIEWVCMSVALFFWLISFLRVPFIGTFFDSVFFEFTVGFAKYPLYALVLIYILCIKIPKLRSVFCNKKRIAWYFTPILILIILLNTIDCYKQGYDVLKAHDLYIGDSGYITNWETYYWYGSVTSFNGNYGQTWLPKPYAWGGILGLIIVFTISYFSPILLIIVLITLFIIFGLILFNKKYKNKKARDVMDDLLKKDSPSKFNKKNKEDHSNSKDIKA